jgi:hypothetical protein
VRGELTVVRAFFQTAQYDAENVQQKSENKYTGLDIIFCMTGKKKKSKEFVL